MAMFTTDIKNMISKLLVGLEIAEIQIDQAENYYIAPITPEERQARNKRINELRKKLEELVPKFYDQYPSIVILLENITNAEKEFALLTAPATKAMKKETEKKKEHTQAKIPPQKTLPN